MTFFVGEGVGDEMVRLFYNMSTPLGTPYTD